MTEPNKKIESNEEIQEFAHSGNIAEGIERHELRVAGMSPSMKRLRWLIGACGGTLVIIAMFIYLGQNGSVFTPGPVLPPDATNTNPVVDPDNPGAGGDFLNETSLTIPAGLEAYIFAQGLTEIRGILIDADDVILSLGNGQLVVLTDDNKDLSYDTVVVLAEQLNDPSGITLLCDVGCSLYVAEANQLTRYTYDRSVHKVLNRTRVVTLPYSEERPHHALISDGDKNIYVSVGASCNVCNEDDTLLARIFRWDVKRGGLEEVASGIREVGGFTSQPKTQDIWFSDKARTGLIDSQAPDEINILVNDAQYGWPLCYGDNIHDLEYDKNRYIQDPCQDAFVTKPHITLAAESKIRAIHFVPDSWPRDYAGDMFAALGGKDPQIAHINISSRAPYQSTGIRSFVGGWKTGSQGPSMLAFSQSRVPVLYVADNGAGTIYAIRPHGASTSTGDGELIDDRRCRATGCNGEICADTEVTTTCLALPQYECLEYSQCVTRESGGCAWLETEPFEACMERYR